MRAYVDDRPCSSRGRESDRLTREEVYQLAGQYHVPVFDARRGSLYTMDKICAGLSQASQKPLRRYFLPWDQTSTNRATQTSTVISPRVVHSGVQTIRIPQIDRHVKPTRSVDGGVQTVSLRHVNGATQTSRQNPLVNRGMQTPNRYVADSGMQTNSRSMINADIQVTPQMHNAQVGTTIQTRNARIQVTPPGIAWNIPLETSRTRQTQTEPDNLAEKLEDCEELRARNRVKIHELTRRLHDKRGDRRASRAAMHARLQRQQMQKLRSAAKRLRRQLLTRIRTNTHLQGELQMLQARRQALERQLTRRRPRTQTVDRGTNAHMVYAGQDRRREEAVRELAEIEQQVEVVQNRIGNAEQGPPPEQWMLQWSWRQRMAGLVPRWITSRHVLVVVLTSLLMAAIFYVLYDHQTGRLPAPETPLPPIIAELTPQIQNIIENAVPVEIPPVMTAPVPVPLTPVETAPMPPLTATGNEPLSIRGAFTSIWNRLGPAALDIAAAHAAEGLGAEQAAIGVGAQPLVRGHLQPPGRPGNFLQQFAAGGPRLPLT